MYALLTMLLVAFSAALVTAMHLHLTTTRPGAMALWTTDDVDAEFFRIIDREGLRDLSMP